MICRDCKKEIPEIPVFFHGKRSPLCLEDFLKRRHKARRREVRLSWWRRLFHLRAPNNVFVPIQHG